MNVGEIRELLANYNPNDDLLLITTSQKIGHITGINHELSQSKQCIVIKCEWDEVIKEKESFREACDKEIQQIQDLKSLVDRKAFVQEVLEMQGKVAKESRKKPKIIKGKKKVRKENRTFAQQLCDGFIPTGKKGRPRKIDPTRLSLDVRLLLKPEKVEEMTPSELEELMVKINKEINWKKL